LTPAMRFHAVNTAIMLPCYLATRNSVLTAGPRPLEPPLVSVLLYGWAICTAHISSADSQPSVDKLG